MVQGNSVTPLIKYKVPVFVIMETVASHLKKIGCCISSEMTSVNRTSFPQRYVFFFRIGTQFMLVFGDRNRNEAGIVTKVQIYISVLAKSVRVCFIQSGCVMK